jgi:hypothetical protein
MEYAEEEAKSEAPATEPAPETGTTDPQGQTN